MSNKNSRKVRKRTHKKIYKGHLFFSCERHTHTRPVKFATGKNLPRHLNYCILSGFGAFNEPKLEINGFVGDLEVASTADIRNIILLGHGGAGKTSLAEAILHKTGATNRLGSVDDKTSICDYYDEEKGHGHSIKSSAVHTQFAGKSINIIDTPGYPDFIGPSIKAIPAAETTIIVINATAGIETVTRKAFELATKAHKAKIIVINKMDAENVEWPRLIKDIQECFGTQCRCANLPAPDHASVIDCIENSSGSSPVMDAAVAHTELIESVIEADEALWKAILAASRSRPEKYQRCSSRRSSLALSFQSSLQTPGKKSASRNYSVLLPNILPRQYRLLPPS